MGPHFGRLAWNFMQLQHGNGIFDQHILGPQVRV
jgi:hypothetical protein